MLRNIGRRNRYAAFKVRATGRDAAGQPLTTWSTLRSEWASITPPRATSAERTSENRTVASGLYLFEIHYCTDITVDMRVEVEGETYSIVDVVPDVARRGYTHLMCARGVF